MASEYWASTFLLLLAFMIPFAKKFVPGFIVLFGLACMIKAIRDRRIYSLSKDLPLLLLALLFLLHIIGLSYSDNEEYAWTEIGIKLSFFAFPFIALFLHPIRKELFEKVCVSFILGCLGYLVISITSGAYQSFITKDISYLSYELLSEPYHPTYAATYQAMSVFMMMYYASRDKYLLGKKYLHWSLCILMLLFISMLASKAGLIAAIIALVIGGYSLVKNHWSVGRSIVLSGSFILFNISTAFLLPGVSSRLQGAVKDLGTNTKQAPTNNMQQQLPEAHSSTALRMVTWSASWQLLKENPIGVGTGDTTNELVKIYTSKGEHHAAEKNLNAHNQFLQTAAELGWPALITLCLILVLLFLRYLKTRDLLLLVFLLLIGMNFLFESFIEVQAGIVYFCFWIMIFLRKENAYDQLAH